MLHLTAVYTQTKNKRWDAYIVDAEHIHVEQAEDLDTAKTLLRIYTAEEVSQMLKHNTDWDIVEEEVYAYYVST